MVSIRGKQIRADAYRNRDAIIEASLGVLGSNPHASVADVAAAAGISRSTLYAHLPSRRALVEAAFRRAISLLDRDLTNLDPALGPRDSLDRLVGASSWVLGSLPSIMSAAEQEVDHAQLRRMRTGSLAGIQRILEKGRSEGVFRTDQDVRWQAQCVLAVTQAGALRVKSGCPQPMVTGEMTSTLRAMLEIGSGWSA